MSKEETALEKVEKQADLYKDLLALIKKEHKLLKEEKDVTNIQDQKRGIRDEIQDIELMLNVKHNMGQAEKLGLIKNSDSEKLQQFKPLLKELYDLEKENQKLA
ncbi:flagellar biosynthesis protein FlgN [Selenihalanaerobacter shriftii]|uniref:Uncharacterized protein n=1 Tax=Selenihalanaerobacter shriftii TaxID=142842 RepID=A0A1T4KLP4_9FIRM|nr:flagellar biosynthesis protein FlgN [Selenihalanaerobacter shriftii]SJZ43329.1 hypothetical protein SAMN02745118_00832 [Selenihalanaerobacter shriftii]